MVGSIKWLGIAEFEEKLPDCATETASLKSLSMPLPKPFFDAS
jgi:hypothetical protein